MTTILWLCIALTVFCLAVLMREDWYHIAHPRRRVDATVVGHHRRVDDGSEAFAPVLQFKDDNQATVEVIDAVYSPTPTAAIGSVRKLEYPLGHPDKARIRRPVMRIVGYVAVLALLAMLVLRLNNWIS
jgi:hypothetical protein